MIENHVIVHLQTREIKSKENGKNELKTKQKKI